jgi:hypothetical protein
MNRRANLATARSAQGFILVTSLLFLSVFTLLTLVTVQLATQDLLLAANIQQRALAANAAEVQLDQSRATQKPAEAVTWTWLGCQSATWLPLDPSAPPDPVQGVYQLHATQLGAAGARAQVLAIIALPAAPSCAAP